MHAKNTLLVIVVKVAKAVVAAIIVASDLLTLNKLDMHRALTINLSSGTVDCV